MHFLPFLDFNEVRNEIDVPLTYKPVITNKSN